MIKLIGVIQPADIIDIRSKVGWESGHIGIREEVPALKAIFARLRGVADSIQHENHWETRAGELRLIEWSNVALRDKNGATAFIQPGGSMRDGEVIAAADRLGVAMVFTGIRHFRH